ncbi:MAG: hypothetical protein ACI8QC_000400 [Planctomycetota bacterium]|jgi:hypothetical protein
MSTSEGLDGGLFGAALQDPLELLLPEGGERQEIARRWSRALSLVRSAGRNDQSQSAGVNPGEALRVLHGRGRDSDQAALEVLLGLHLDACLGPDSWHAWRMDSGTAAQAWARLGEGRAPAPPVPEPGESAAQVARRLLDLAAGGGMDPERLGLWEARLGIVQGDLAGARLQLGKCSLSSAATDLAALDLQRGAVQTAREHLLAAVSLDARGIFLAAACGVLLGEPGAQRPMAQVRRGAGPLPLALAELGAVHAPAKSSGEPRAGAAALIGTDALDCEALGASVLVLVVLERDAAGALQRRVPVRSVAVELEGAGDAWETGRACAWQRLGEPEQELLTSAGLVQRHRQPGAGSAGPWLGSMDPQALALVLVPVLDERSEPMGWLHLEFSHHLVPSSTRLQALARSCRPRCLREQREARVTAPQTIAEPWGAGPMGGALAHVFEELVGELAMKTTRRRWFAFAMGPAGPQLVASAGRFSGFGDPSGVHAGGGRALERARITGARVTWDTPSPPLSVDARSASGVVFPMQLGSETLALFVVESSINRDLREADLARLESKFQARRTAMVAARFRSRHLASYGWQPHLPTGIGDFDTFADRLRILAPRRAALVLVGGPGSGKGVFMRWAHELAHAEHSGPDAGLRPWSPGGSLEQALQGSGQSLWIHAPERLTLVEQELLTERLANPSASQAKLLISTERDPRLPAHGLQHALARALCRVVLSLPPLADRRAELPGWIDALAQRIAKDEGLPEPRWDDDALALLWRQPWESGLRDLDVVLHGLLLESRGDSIDRETAHTALRSAGLEVLPRLASRQPRRADLLAAIATTRTSSGRVNKTRAALYLGWDPDTLVTRSAELGIDLASPEAPTAWALAQTPP